MIEYPTPTIKLLINAALVSQKYRFDKAVTRPAISYNSNPTPEPAVESRQVRRARERGTGRYRGRRV